MLLEADQPADITGGDSAFPQQQRQSAGEEFAMSLPVAPEEVGNRIGAVRRTGPLEGIPEVLPEEADGPFKPFRVALRVGQPDLLRDGAQHPAEPPGNFPVFLSGRRRFLPGGARDNPRHQQRITAVADHPFAAELTICTTAHLIGDHLHAGDISGRGEPGVNQRRGREDADSLPLPFFGGHRVELVCRHPVFRGGRFERDSPAVPAVVPGAAAVAGEDIEPQIAGRPRGNRPERHFGGRLALFRRERAVEFRRAAELMRMARRPVPVELADSHPQQRVFPGPDGLFVLPVEQEEAEEDSGGQNQRNGEEEEVFPARPPAPRPRRQQSRDRGTAEGDPVKEPEMVRQQQVQRQPVRLRTVAAEVAADQKGHQSRRRRDADAVPLPAEPDRQRRRVEEKGHDDAGAQKIGHEPEPLHPDRHQIVAECGQDQRDDDRIGDRPVGDAPAVAGDAGQRQQKKRENRHVRQIRRHREEEERRQKNCGGGENHPAGVLFHLVHSDTTSPF